MDALTSQVDRTAFRTLGAADLKRSDALRGHSKNESTGSFKTQVDRQISTLGQVGQILGRDAAASPEAAVRKGAEELVASAFFKPIFEMVREDPLRSDVIPISSGEKMFGPLLDAEFSKRITERADFPITEAIVDRMMAAMPRPVSQPEPTTTSSADPHRLTGVDSHA